MWKEKQKKKKKIEEERQKNEEKSKILYIQCHLNLAAATLRMKKYDDAKDHCKKVLEHDPKNVKAIFRLAMTHKSMDNYETAIEQLNVAAEIQNSKEVQKELAECKKLHKERLAREKSVYTDMFKKLDSEKGLYDGVEPGKPPRWKCQYCDEEMDQVQQARHIIKFHSGEKRDKISKKDLGLPDQIPLDLKVTPL